MQFKLSVEHCRTVLNSLVPPQITKIDQREEVWKYKQGESFLILDYFAMEKIQKLLLSTVSLKIK